MATVRRPGAIKDHNHQNSSRRDRRTSGEATVLGEPTGSIAVRRRIGFLGGDKRAVLVHDCTGDHCIHASIVPAWRVDSETRPGSEERKAPQIALFSQGAHLPVPLENCNANPLKTHRMAVSIMMLPTVLVHTSTCSIGCCPTAQTRSFARLEGRTRFLGAFTTAKPPRYANNRSPFPMTSFDDLQ